ncbi:MAG: hypothetical protein J6Z04_03250 [Clostridia bacterium]|nr:hypothetical protein [Clostridia bacterium]
MRVFGAPHRKYDGFEAPLRTSTKRGRGAIAAEEKVTNGWDSTRPLAGATRQLSPDYAKRTTVSEGESLAFAPQTQGFEAPLRTPTKQGRGAIAAEENVTDGWDSTRGGKPPRYPQTLA